MSGWISFFKSWNSPQTAFEFSAQLSLAKDNCLKTQKAQKESQYLLIASQTLFPTPSWQWQSSASPSSVIFLPPLPISFTCCLYSCFTRRSCKLQRLWQQSWKNDAVNIRTGNKKGNIKENVAIYLTVVNAVLKSSGTDLDFFFFLCNSMCYSLFTSM